MSFLKSAPPVCALMTDFGLADHYAGVVKGVIQGLVPGASIIDLSHLIPPQDIRAGAFQLMAGAPYFPQDTLFVGIVDPGVGTERRILCAEAGGRRYLAPDNGLLSWVFEMTPPKVVVGVSKALSSGAGLSRTFHGRDVFAPLAGRLLNGESPPALGSRIKDWVKLPFPVVGKTGSRWVGEIISVDRFGNLITNIKNADMEALSRQAKVWIDLGKKGGAIRGISESYSAVPQGKLLAVPGSAGFLEISERDGDASRKTGLTAGGRLTVSFKT